MSNIKLKNLVQSYFFNYFYYYSLMTTQSNIIHQEYNKHILKPSVPGFTESKNKHFQAFQDAHKLFVDLFVLSAQLVFVKRAGGFPNQADSTTTLDTHVHMYTCTHTHTHTR